MRKVLISILAMFTFATAAVGTRLYANSQSFEYPRSVVYQISSEYSSGSGVMVADGLMLTAFHVVGEKGEGMLVNGKPIVVLKFDRDLDIALIQVEQGCPCVPLATSLPDEDSKVLAVGFPLSLGKVATEGRSQNLLKDGKLLHTSPIAFGNSGGGLFMWNGYHWVLVGITVQVAGAPLGMGFGIPVFHLVGSVSSPSIIKWIHSTRE